MLSELHKTLIKSHEDHIIINCPRFISMSRNDLLCVLLLPVVRDHFSKILVPVLTTVLNLIVSDHNLLLDLLQVKLVHLSP